MAKKKTSTSRRVAAKKATAGARRKRPAARGSSSTGRKSPAKKRTTKKAPARKSTAKKATGRKTPAKKAATKKAATKRRPTKKATAKKATARKAPAKKAATKKTAAKKVPSRKSAAPATAAPQPVGPAGRTNSAKRKTTRRVVMIEEVVPTPPRPLKSPYTKTQLRPMRRALMQLRKRTLFDLGMLGDEALRASDPDVDAESVADHGSDAYERNVTLGLMEHDSKRIRQIDDALASMDGGTYGACQHCADPIPLARLEALPFAATCVSCKEREERRF